jgi:hypothetical protein
MICEDSMGYATGGARRDNALKEIYLTTGIYGEA